MRKVPNLPTFTILLVQVFVMATLLKGVDAGRKVVHIASPLQSLTIWDPEVKEDKKTRRELFLQKFRAGLQAEVDARTKLLEMEEVGVGGTPASMASINPNSRKWAQRAAEVDRNQFLSNEKLIERAHDDAIEQVEDEIKAKMVAMKKRTREGSSQQKYQFVGVINNSQNAKSKQQPPITWYARNKPKNSLWTMRLVHVNRDAIIKDLFNQGDIDIFAKYNNEGLGTGSTETTGISSNQKYNPIVTSQYIVRKKSWK
jgi:hypothetical protein